jgi:DNA-binding CsgD family transcriptional regulator
MPHLERALRIRDRLEAHQLRADSLDASVAQLSCGVVVLDSRAHIIEANSIAEQLLRTEPTVRREPDNSLWLDGKAGIALRRAVTSRSGAVQRAAYLLTRPAGRLPLSVLIAALPEAVSWTGQTPRWLVLLFDPERKVVLAADALATAYGITARESQLIAELALRGNLDEVAQRMGIARHTAQTHLKSIFAKMGIRSQTELVSRVLGHAAALSADEPARVTLELR